VADLLHHLPVGGLLGGLAGLHAPLGQGQLVALGAGGVFADEQGGVRVAQGDDDDRAVAGGDQPLVVDAGAVGEGDVQRLHLEQAGAGDGLALVDAGLVGHGAMIAERPARPRPPGGRTARSVQGGQHALLHPAQQQGGGALGGGRRVAALAQAGAQLGEGPPGAQRIQRPGLVGRQRAEQDAPVGVWDRQAPSLPQLNCPLKNA